MIPQDPVTHTLSNGVRACIEPYEGAQSFAVCLRMNGGTVEDPQNMLGLASVMETALMKGTAKRDAAGLFDALDALGVEKASSTGTESFTFTISLLPGRLREALPLYREMFETATFPEEEVELAKKLAVERILSLEDEPRRKVVNLVRKAALGDPLGRPTYGTEETVAAINRQAVRSCLNDVAHPRNLIISAAGGMSPSLFFEIVDSVFGDWQKDGETPQSIAPTITPGVIHEYKESEQAHIAVMYPSVSRGAEDYYPALMASAVLSEGGSSRLFTEVREKRGLVYHVGTMRSPFRAGAVMLLYAGTRAERAQETLSVCLTEVERLAIDISREELDRAKAVALGRLHTIGRLAGARASTLATDMFLEGRPHSLNDIIQGIESVTLEQTLDAAARYTPQPRTVVVLGPNTPEGIQ